MVADESGDVIAALAVHGQIVLLVVQKLVRRAQHLARLGSFLGTDVALGPSEELLALSPDRRVHAVHLVARRGSLRDEPAATCLGVIGVRAEHDDSFHGGGIPWWRGARILVQIE